MSSKDRVSPLPIGLPPGVTGRVTPTRSPDPDPTLPALPPESAGERRGRPGFFGSQGTAGRRRFQGGEFFVRRRLA